MISQVLARPELGTAVLLCLLGVSHNRALRLPPPPGSDKPVHASLCTLAAQLRLLLASLLGASTAAAGSSASAVASAATARLRLTRLATVRAVCASLEAAASFEWHTRGAGEARVRAAAAEGAPAAASVSASRGEGGRGDGGRGEGGSSCSFAVWLGCELGARRGGVRGGPTGGGGGGGGRLGLFLRHGLKLVYDRSVEVVGASVALLEAVLRSPSACELDAWALGALVHAALSLLSSSAPPTQAGAYRLLALCAPAALGAINPHAPFGTYSRTRGLHENAEQGATRGSAAERWRRKVLSTPLPGYGPLQLLRTLKLLSGKAAQPFAPAHARLFSICAVSQPGQLRELIATVPQLGSWWAGLEASRQV